MRPAKAAALQRALEDGDDFTALMIVKSPPRVLPGPHEVEILHADGTDETIPETEFERRFERCQTCGGWRRR